MNFDKAGRSEGSAELTFTTAELADEAVRKFDGAPAAGKSLLDKGKIA